MKNRRRRAPSSDNRSLAELGVPSVRTRASANLFLLGILFNQGERAARAWRGPKELGKRLGTLEPGTIAALDVYDIANAMAHPPSLHRHGVRVAAYVHAAMTRLHEEYRGDARNIWSPSVPTTELLNRFTAFYGIGAHKASVGAFLLTKHLGIDVIDDGNWIDIERTCPALLRYVGLGAHSQ